MIITCLKELEEKKELELEDFVYFVVKNKKMRYKVQNIGQGEEPRRCYLRCKSNLSDNSEIFRSLKIDDSYELAKTMYGYPPVDGSILMSSLAFPETKTDDFAALTRLIKKLYEIVEEKYSEKKYTSFTRFEIMEL